MIKVMTLSTKPMSSNQLLIDCRRLKTLDRLVKDAEWCRWTRCITLEMKQNEWSYRHTHTHDTTRSDSTRWIHSCRFVCQKIDSFVLLLRMWGRRRRRRTTDIGKWRSTLHSSQLTSLPLPFRSLTEFEWSSASMNGAMPCKRERFWWLRLISIRFEVK